MNNYMKLECVILHTYTYYLTVYCQPEHISQISTANDLFDAL